MKKACLSAFQELPSFVSSAIKTNIDLAFKEKDNIDRYFAYLRHKKIIAEVKNMIREGEERLTQDVQKFVINSDVEFKASVEGKLN